MLEWRIEDILECPDCRGHLAPKRAALACQSCRRTFKFNGKVPVFLSEPALDAPLDHVSNPIGAEYEEILRHGEYFVLHIGAGATPQKYANCVEFERKIFKHTDVVGDAHYLPFRDRSFDRVFAFNVFEHLREPARAAAEIARVLKPSGLVAIHTAFLQALHEEPAHFYNATEYGLRAWFADFEIQKLSVSANFSPGVMLAYLMSSILTVVQESGTAFHEQVLLRDTTLGNWAEFWAGKTGPPDGFEALQKLPQSSQKKIAAGFELIGRKPQPR